MTSAAVETTPLTCDVLVVGSGAAGLAAAVTAAWHGRRVVLVEMAGDDSHGAPP
ncbi:FAD-binding protein, partial [Pseudomonas aeruginosa]|uniref:FAD-binding protein n=1 Tax=Pseudomonas aeruginosa TaxID=287 RepID=UPI002E2252D7|nr:FAD-binding protein [Pseudomonas aeruginosa]